MIYLTASVAGLVFLRAIQQLNVVHHMYLYAAITSYLIAVAEVAVIIGIVGAGWPAVPWVGTGGAIGVVSAMAMHKTWA
jgi:hypothetical protein